MTKVKPLPETPTPAPTHCACGHPFTQHDSIASRYCAATASGGLQRGCICAAVLVEPLAQS
jgi:hypothetical protein